MVNIESTLLPDRRYRAYLDIETTGLSPTRGDLTVIGICLEDDDHQQVIQLLENDISSAMLFKIIERVDMLYTYNGTRFDLPYIKAKLGIDLAEHCFHIDLMYECWRKKLYGGLKGVEKQLKIKRKLIGIDGKKAVNLWYDYKFYGNKQALLTLLEYNKEDVLNLILVREKLYV